MSTTATKNSSLIEGHNYTFWQYEVGYQRGNHYTDYPAQVQEDKAYNCASVILKNAKPLGEV